MIYSIGEFAQKVGLPSSTLRYYEKEGLIKPKRSATNLRLFEEADIDWVLFLLHLKGTGMSMQELKQYTVWRAQGDETIVKRMQLLNHRRQEVEAEMKSLQQNLTILNRKLAFYDDRLSGKKYQFQLHPEQD